MQHQGIPEHLPVRMSKENSLNFNRINEDFDDVLKKIVTKLSGVIRIPIHLE